jgi:3-hydroxyisobutyrate dehydrogenase-like beta-hydroxyacid dehydrogenase
MKITYLGYGNVGAPLADHLQRLGHHVTLATGKADSDSLRKALARNSRLEVAPPKEAL